MSGASDSDSSRPDPEVADRIRSMLLGLSADLVAHVSRSTGVSPNPHPELPIPVPPKGGEETSSAEGGGRARG